MCHSDEECVRRCLDGEAHIYRCLVRRHRDAVTAYMAGHLGSLDLAEEAAQEAFVRAYFSLRALRKRESFRSWLLGIALRVGRELERGRGRAATGVDLAGIPARTAADLPDPALAQAVAGLPGIYREMIFLRFHAGLSCAEAAVKLGLPVGTVTKRLSRAYALLREALSEDERHAANTEASP